MPLQLILKNLRFLLLLLIAVTELQANTLQIGGGGVGEKVNRVLQKRGHSTSGGGLPNDYGPAIKITSSVLQLTKAMEGSNSFGDLGLEHHETTLDHPWLVSSVGAQLPAAQTVWLELPASQRDFHLIPVPDVSNYHFPQALDGGAGASDSTDETASTLSKGLHTQIISSDKGVTHVSDNLDFGEASERTAKGHYRISYGR